jgi:HEAT repeat protein
MFLFGPPNIDKLRRERKIDKLVKILRGDKRSNLREQAAYALGQILAEGTLAAGKPAINALMWCLIDPSANGDLFVSAINALLLSNDGSKALMEYIRYSYHDDYKTRELVREQIMQVLTQTSNEKYSEFFYGLLSYPIDTMHSFKDKMSKARLHVAAIKALSKIGDKKANPIIEQYLERFQSGETDLKEFGFVATAAKETLRRYGKKTTKQVANGLSYENPETHGPVSDSPKKQLAPRPKNISRKLLRLIAQDRLDEAAQLDGPVITTLIKHLKKPSYLDVHLGIVKTLAKTGDKSIVKPLITIIEDENNLSSLRIAAIEALSMTNLSENPEAKDSIAQQLSSSNTLISAVALTALGQLGDTRAVKPLIAKLKSNENIESLNIKDETIHVLVDTTQRLLELSATALDFEDLERLAHLQDLKRRVRQFIVTDEWEDEDEYGRHTVSNGYWDYKILSTVDLSPIRELAQQELMKRKDNIGRKQTD